MGVRPTGYERITMPEDRRWSYSMECGHSFLCYLLGCDQLPKIFLSIGNLLTLWRISQKNRTVMKNLYVFLLAAMMYMAQTSAQQTTFVTLPDQLENPAFASWISHPSSPGNDYGVYYFRKSVRLSSVPDSFTVHVSADNRYRLFVNGELASWGPAVGDLNNWNYETVDISHLLKPGQNVLAAQVWNFGAHRAPRQNSHRTAFILQGDGEKERDVNSNVSWKVTQDMGYYPIDHTSDAVGGGYIAGATDSLVAAKHPWGWEKPIFEDTQWLAAQELGKGNHSGLNTWLGTPWLLQPRGIPVMEQKKEAPPKLVWADKVNLTAESLSEDFHFTVPKNSKITLLLDNEVLTMGFPKLKVSLGKGAKIKIQYQESLFDEMGKKGNRDVWQDKHMKGYYDVFMADGGQERVLEPLWIRVFRYVKIEIETKDEPLKVHDFHNLYTAYPLKQNGFFSSDDTRINDIWDVSWRTARLCALETYMDCPYYEQLQYIGDTRIQALISLYVDGDDRLARNAISQFYNSMQPMGLTKSNHPSTGVQIIPPFSLVYIGMLYDYFMLRDDPDFIKKYLPGIKFILEWFLPKIEDSGMLGPLTYWNHIDGGTAEFAAGSPPGIEEGGSAHMTILLAKTLQDASEMLRHYGDACTADLYSDKANQLLQATVAQCFDEKRGLLAETPKKELFTQHTNAIAILADTFEERMNREIAEKMISDHSLAQATLYFNFYVFQALKKVGKGGEVIQEFKKWEAFLDQGFTTFPEHGIESRSDCHAWSSHPMYDVLNITCGVSPAAPGFKLIEVRPQLGNLTKIEGKMVHPSGIIKTSFRKNDTGKIDCQIVLPSALEGTLIWKTQRLSLKEGSNNFELE